MASYLLYPLPSSGVTGASPAGNLVVQLRKLAVGLLSNRYVPSAAAAATKAFLSAKAAGALGEEELAALQVAAEKAASEAVVAPRMLKALVGKGHAEFSSSK